MTVCFNNPLILKYPNNLMNRVCKGTKTTDYLHTYWILCTL